MEDLNRASETLATNEKSAVKVVHLPPMTVASAHYLSDNPDIIVKIEGTKAVIKKFITDVDLYEIKPDFRYFGFANSREGQWVYEIMVSIPDDLDVLNPLIKSIYPGGLFASYTCDGPDMGEWKVLHNWANNSDDYAFDAHGGPALEEVFNPYNIYGMKNSDAQKAEKVGFAYFNFLLPIKEIDK